MTAALLAVLAVDAAAVLGLSLLPVISGAARRVPDPGGSRSSTSCSAGPSPGGPSPWPAPVLTAHDLSHLGAYQAAARLVAGSAEQPAFTFRTRPLPPPSPAGHRSSAAPPCRMQRHRRLRPPA
jgi:hypothetical protein